MNSIDERLTASELTPEDRKLLEQISHEVIGDKRPALIGRDNERIELPEPIYHLLVRVVQALQEGNSIILMPENEPMTTQAAADYLGVSRPFLVKILEGGEIPFHNVGTHRRVLLKDLRSYEKQRDEQRRKGMKKLFDQVDDEGLYDTVESDHAG
jgi:excisionase family DNA binding protein